MFKGNEERGKGFGGDDVEAIRKKKKKTPNLLGATIDIRAGLKEKRLMGAPGAE